MRHPRPALTTSARRASAAAAVKAAAPDLPALAATVAIDVIDGAVHGALSAIRLSDDEGGAVLAAWLDHR